ncbi:MAG: phenylalanine--tRNA ligase subunit alpha [Alphaproteobacteria bacterium]|nr:phenylalanine--tRNA ligase subunit alpha [Alphaproteobacteria bacterium]
MSDLTELQASALVAISAAASVKTIDELRVELLGKRGKIAAAMATLATLPVDERKDFGQRVNGVRDAITAAIPARHEQLAAAELNQRLAAETLDISLPPATVRTGKIHPISQTIDEFIAIFGEMGFSLAEGPDIEDDEHNFTRLNFPPDHPAREMHDTFYLPPRKNGEGNLLLRTHTSPVQVRTMMGQKPPIRIIAPGRTYRSDSDQTHTPMFHQIEGLVIDRSTHMGHLKSCLTEFIHGFFESDDIPLRFRPSFFPFTEPSVEVDIGCSRADGKLLIGNYGDWLEIGGAGMVHPNVLTACGLDAAVYQGFAFGMGVERMAMLKYNIPDLRTFFAGDSRWIEHYGFSVWDLPSLVSSPSLTAGAGDLRPVAGGAKK